MPLVPLIPLVPLDPVTCDRHTPVAPAPSRSTAATTHSPRQCGDIFAYWPHPAASMQKKKHTHIVQCRYAVRLYAARLGDFWYSERNARSECLCIVVCGSTGSLYQYIKHDYFALASWKQNAAKFYNCFYKFSQNLLNGLSCEARTCAKQVLLHRSWPL